MSGTTLRLPPLNPKLPLPIYVQIVDHIREAIESRTLKPGDALPSERELAQHYGVSRMTVRQALDQLADEGLLERRRGAGTFVAEARKIEHGLELTSFTEDMARRGFTASSQILEFGQVPAPGDIARRLDEAPSFPVWRVRRLRLADGEPMAVETTHLSTRLVPALPPEALSGSLYQFLQERYGLHPFEAEQSYEASLARAGDADLLGIRVGAPVLFVTRTTMDVRLRPFECVRSVYRADRYRLTIHLTRRPRPWGR